MSFPKRFTRRISPLLTRPRLSPPPPPPSSSIKPDIHHAQAGGVADPGDLPRSRLSPAPCPSPGVSDTRTTPTARRANKPGARTHSSTTTRLQPSEQDPPTTRRRDRKQPCFDKLRLPSVWQRRKADGAIFIESQGLQRILCSQKYRMPIKRLRSKQGRTVSPSRNADAA